MTTRIRKRLFLQAFSANGGNVANSCAAVHMARQTYYKWLERDQKFNARVAEILESCHDNVKSSVYKESIGGNMKAAEIYLRVHQLWPAERPVDVNINGKIQVDQKFVMLGDEELISGILRIANRVLGRIAQRSNALEAHPEGESGGSGVPPQSDSDAPQT